MFILRITWGGVGVAIGTVPACGMEKTSASQMESLASDWEGAARCRLSYTVVGKMVTTLPVMWEAQVFPWVTKIPWKRKWQPTPVFLPGRSHGQRSRAGYSPWDHKESDVAERLSMV